MAKCLWRSHRLSAFRFMRSALPSDCRADARGDLWRAIALSRPKRALNDIRPEFAKTVYTAGRRTPECGVANQQAAAERVGSRLQEGIECRVVICIGMRRGVGGDPLAGQDFKFLYGLAETLELRQMRMQIESADVL